jgi:hypothetical protein
MTDHTLSADPAWRGLYRAGAISAASATVMYVIGLVLVVATEAPPTDPTGAEMLDYVDAHRALYYVKQLLWLVPSLPMMVVSLALAAAGWRVSRSLSLVAGTVSTFAWAGTYAWLTTGEGSLAMPLLADGYAAASTDLERASFVAGAEMLMAINDMAAPLGVLQTVGILLLGLLMLRGLFPAWLAWLTIVTGVLGIVAEAFRVQLGWAYAVYGLLLFVWLIGTAVVLWWMGEVESYGRVCARSGQHSRRSGLPSSRQERFRHVDRQASR